MVALPSTMLPLGSPLSDFRLPDPEGNLHGPSDVADTEGLLVAFVCNHCPYVRHTSATLGKAAQQWAGQGLAIIAINSNDIASYPEDGPKHMTTFARENDWLFPYLLDETQEVAQRFRAACTPDFFLFDSDQALVYRGQMDSSRPKNDEPVTGEDLRKAVSAVLNGQKPDGEQRPSLGCAIAWKPGNEPG